MQPNNLLDHPEGGKYTEVFRSIHKVQSASLGQRSSLTHIYFQLAEGEVSQFHKVSSEEVWNLYKGQGLRLYQWDGESDTIDVITLSAETNTFCHVVPAHYWQAAEPIGKDEVLVGCSVAPGFEFEDFTLIRDCSGLAQKLITLEPSLSHLAQI
ncbi:cupin domain-containing protein [Rubritalea marina]|uniref:cupin domain-containing protein n=1 Tax=Rubritalea marina TaxID=361055 RepID=UPI0003645BBA|nr:cupin domain-containing protein [Rubritalea marina]